MPQFQGSCSLSEQIAHSPSAITRKSLKRKIHRFLWKPAVYVYPVFSDFPEQHMELQPSAAWVVLGSTIFTTRKPFSSTLCLTGCFPSHQGSWFQQKGQVGNWATAGVIAIQGLNTSLWWRSLSIWWSRLTSQNWTVLYSLGPKKNNWCVQNVFQMILCHELYPCFACWNATVG